MNRTDFLHRHVLDGTVLSIHSLPQEEVVAVLQYSEMNEDNDYIKCGLVFDTICNLWNYIGETEVQNFSSLSDSEQFDYFKNVKADFLDWFSKENISNDMDLEILNNAIHLPLLHRMSGHSTLEIIICYLLC